MLVVLSLVREQPGWRKMIFFHLKMMTSKLRIFEFDTSYFIPSLSSKYCCIYLVLNITHVWDVVNNNLPITYYY